MNNINIDEKLIRAVVSRNQNYTKINYHMNKNIMLQLIINYDEIKDCIYMYGLFDGRWTYEVATMTIGRTELSYECSCYYNDEDSACAHIGAMLRYYANHQGEIQFPFILNLNRLDEEDIWKWEESFPNDHSLEVYKSQLTERRLLSQYDDQATSSERFLELKIKKTLEDVKVERHEELFFEMLIKDDDTLSVKVGGDKKYVIKDIDKFIRRMNTHEYFSYGKQLAFVHDEKFFDEDGKKIIEFLRKMNNRFGGIYQLYIDEDVIPYLYELYESLDDKSIFVNLNCTQDIFKLDLSIKEENILDRKFYIISIDDYDEDNYYLLRNTNIIYRYENKTICKYINDNIDHFIDLLNMYRMNHPIVVKENSLNEFVSYYLDPIKEDINIHGFELTNYYLPDMTINFYADLNEFRQITIMPVVQKYNDNYYLLDFNYNDKTYKEKIVENVLKQLCDEIDPILAKGIVYEKRIFDFAKYDINVLKDYGKVYISESLKNISIRKNLNVSVGVRIDAGMLKVNIDTDELSQEELFKILGAYHKKKKYYILKDGTVVDLENNDELMEIDELDRRLHFEDAIFKNGEYQFDQSQAFRIDDLEDIEKIKIERADSFEKLINTFNSNSYANLPENYNHILRNYQKAGFYWLKKLENMHMNGILADDMGLGKTVQVISLLESSKEADRYSLVVCPSSLLLNWEEEIHKFSKVLTCQAIKGNASQRALQINDCDKYDINIITYDALKRDLDLFEDKKFYYVILDEAQYIKNQRTKNANAVKALASEHRLALTGTPIENSLAELWSIFDFLMPKFLFNYHYFQNTYEKPIVSARDEDISKELKHLVEPFILRRTKKEVLKELPDKVETIYSIDFSEEEWKLYLANLSLVNKELNEQLKMDNYNKFMILSMLTRLRQICCDPHIVFEEYKEHGSKMNACVELIESIHESGKKMLLFSSFTTVLDELRKLLNEKGINSYTIQGSTPKEERKRLVDQFQIDDTPVFLISLKAGGTGLNLTAAEAVIHYDPWWNLSVQNQATDRAHRIGQTNTVTVYNLIMKDSIEDKIMKLQQQKKNLADVFVEDSKGSIANMSKEEMLDLFAIPKK